MQRALIVSVLVGVMCPVIGAYVVARGRAFMGDALAHSVLPGMGVGLLATGTALIAAVPTGVAIALLMGFISRRTGSSEDTSIGIVFAGMFALGLVMLSSPLYINTFLRLRDTQAPNIEDLLIGEILGVSTGEVYLSLGAGVAGDCRAVRLPSSTRVHHLRPGGRRGGRNQSPLRRIRAARPPRPGHRHQHPGGRNRPRHGDAHHAGGDRVPPREAVCRRHAHRRGESASSPRSWACTYPSTRTCQRGPSWHSSRPRYSVLRRPGASGRRGAPTNPALWRA